MWPDAFITLQRGAVLSLTSPTLFVVFRVSQTRVCFIKACLFIDWATAANRISPLRGSKVVNFKFPFSPCFLFISSDRKVPAEKSGNHGCAGRMHQHPQAFWLSELRTTWWTSERLCRTIWCFWSCATVCEGLQSDYNWPFTTICRFYCYYWGNLQPEAALASLAPLDNSRVSCFSASLEWNNPGFLVFSSRQKSSRTTKHQRYQSTET